MTVAIGICAAVERASWSHWDDRVALVPRGYVDMVQEADGLALVLPPDDVAAESPGPLLDRVDALLLTGGADIDPATYGALPHPKTGETRPERDRFELALVHEAIERDMPVLGICRGGQMINVACGGTSFQHLPEQVAHDGHLESPGTFSEHDVELTAGSLAARAVGAELTTVKSHHHQGIGELGDGLTISGRSSLDGIAEAVESTERGFVLGVLWHPEADERSKVISALVRAARTRVAST